MGENSLHVIPTNKEEMMELEKSPYVATTLQASIISGSCGGHTLK